MMLKELLFYTSVIWICFHKNGRLNLAEGLVFPLYHLPFSPSLFFFFLLNSIKKKAKLGNYFSFPFARYHIWLLIAATL